MFSRSRERVLLWSRPRLTKTGYTGRFTSWNSPRMQRLQSVCALDNCNVRCHHDMIYYYYYYYLIGVSRKSFPKKEAKINAYNGSLYFVVPALRCNCIYVCAPQYHLATAKQVGLSSLEIVRLLWKLAIALVFALIRWLSAFKSSAFSFLFCSTLYIF